MSTPLTNPPDSRSPLEVCANLIQAIARTDRPDHIYQAALDALADGLGVDRAAVLLFDPDGVMRFKAWRGLSDSYREAVEGHTPWAANAKGAGPIVVANVEHDPSLLPYRQALDAERIAALTFIPLEGVDGVLGKFMLYYGEPGNLSADELQLAQVIAAQIAFAVERTQAQEAAKANHDRLRYALDAANMGTWDWDLRTQSVRWSENMERIHGLVPGTFDGTFASYDREIHPEDREQVYASIRRALAGGVPHEVEYRIVAPDGTFRWVEGKGRVEPGPDGQPRYVTGIDADTGTVHVGDAAALDVSTLVGERPVFTSGVAPSGPVECTVQVRAHGGIADGVAELRDGQWAVDLRAPLRGVAPGQTMVLYRPDPEGDEVIGSATITR